MESQSGDNLKPESVTRVSVPVRLIGFPNRIPIEAELSIGIVIGEGESGIVRESELIFKRGGNSRKYEVAIKTYRGQDESRNSGLPNEVSSEVLNEAYKAQLVLYNILKRIGASVIPTFRLAEDINGNILGIVMTNLEIKPLDSKSKVTKVTSTKTDLIGRDLNIARRSRDKHLANDIGLSLDEDSWMLQYSSRWLNIGKLIPTAVISDIIGIRIINPVKLKEFLERKGNEDLKLEINNIPSLGVRLS